MWHVSKRIIFDEKNEKNINELMEFAFGCQFDYPWITPPLLEDDDDDDAELAAPPPRPPAPND